MNLGKFAELDAPTRARIEAACNFINHKIEQLRRRVTLVTLSALAAAALVWLVTEMDPRYPFMGAVLVSALVGMQAKRELAKWYKGMVIRRVVEALGEGVTYERESSLTKSQFHDMDLFRERADSWKSEDQVSGRRNAIGYALHEVRAARQEKRENGSHEIVFFRGLIVVLEFNKNFHGHTVIVPDREGKRLGGLFGEATTRRQKQVVRLADPAFEQLYTVYSTDDQEAHYLLTPKLLELVLKARQNFGDLRLAFYQNSLFVAVPSNHDRFEVGLFTSRVTALTVIDDMAAVMALAEQLIDVLDLETRIWTRV